MRNASFQFYPYSKLDGLAFDELIDVQNMKHTTTQFDFAAKPRVTGIKSKYREERLDGTNLMNDPRVVRGNTYAAIVQNKNDIQPPPKQHPQTKPRKRQRQRINFDTGFELATPRAVDGRDHFSVQTEPFVETLRDRPIQYQKESQTDLYLDRPVEREFDAMKGKSGVDRTTQIEENDPELFNFDYQVEPIVQALFSKIVETSRMELFQEKELRKKEKQKDQYERRRHVRLAQAQKLQANEVRLKEEYDRRHLQYRKASEQQAATQRKMIGRVLAKQYLSHLHDNTYRMLDFQSFFRQPLQTQLYSSFAPWLYNEILQELHSRNEYTNATEELVARAAQQVAAESEGFVMAYRQERQGIQRQREERKMRREAEKEQKQRKKEEAELVAVQGEGENEGGAEPKQEQAVQQ